MRRYRLAHLDLDAAPVPECVPGPAANTPARSACDPCADDLLAGPWPDRDNHARRLHGHAAASEAARADSGRIEHPEVQPAPAR